MQLYEYIVGVIEEEENEGIEDKSFKDFKIKKNKSGTNTMLTKPNGEKYLIVDLNKLRR